LEQHEAFARDSPPGVLRLFNSQYLSYMGLIETGVPLIAKHATSNPSKFPWWPQEDSTLRFQVLQLSGSIGTTAK